MQKGSYQIGFRPRSSLIDPFFWIFKRIVDIVNVYNHSDLEPRQNVEQDVIDVAVDLLIMAQVDEENVPLRKIPKDFAIHLLTPCPII